MAMWDKITARGNVNDRRGTREIRIFYCFHKNKAVLLHACIKKTQKTLDKELTRAREAKQHLR